MTATKAKAIAAIAQAGIAFLLVTQSDVALPPLLKVLLGLGSVILAAVDWGAIIGDKE